MWKIVRYKDLTTAIQRMWKIVRYKDLTTAVQRMWNVTTEVIPVITVATGTVCKSFTKYLSYIPSKHDIKELQQTAILTLHTYCGKYWCKVQNIERGK
jgi:hypothetical protein